MRNFFCMIALASLVQCSTLASAQNTPAQFNLTCIGQQFVGDAKNFEREELWKRYVVVYRIDLESQRWCRDECRETFELSRVNSTEIFINGTPEERYSEVHYVTKINRETGKLSSSFTLGPNLPVIWQNADCLREPFTGFPSLRF